MDGGPLDDDDSESDELEVEIEMVSEPSALTEPTSPIAPTADWVPGDLQFVDDALEFVLFSIDVRQGDPSKAKFNDAYAFDPDVLSTIRRPNVLAGAKGGRISFDEFKDMSSPCFAYLTGHTATGVKIGLVIPWKPSFVVRLESPEARRMLEFALLTSFRDDFRTKFYVQDLPTVVPLQGYEPSAHDPKTRAPFIAVLITCKNLAVRSEVARVVRRYGVKHVTLFDFQWTLPGPFWSHVHEDGIEPNEAFRHAWNLAPGEWHRIHKDYLDLKKPTKCQMLVAYEFEVKPPKHEPGPWSGTWAALNGAEPGPWLVGQILRKVSPPRNELASMVAASLDIEVTSGSPGRWGVASNPDDAIVVIGIVCWYVGGDAPGRPRNTSFRRVALVYAPNGIAGDMVLPGVDVQLFTTEAAMLAEVPRVLFHDTYTDVLVGHNITGYDIKYMVARALMHGAAAAPFFHFGALHAESLGCAVNPAGTRHLLHGVGFATLDSVLVARSEAKFAVNTLSAIASKVLGPGPDNAKHDVPYSAIHGIVAGKDVGPWTSFVAYCIQDCELVLRVLTAPAWDKIGAFAVRSAIYATQLPVNTVCGQQVRVRNAVMDEARAHVPPMVLTRVNVSAPRHVDGIMSAVCAHCHERLDAQDLADKARVRKTVVEMDKTPKATLDALATWACGPCARKWSTAAGGFVMGNVPGLHKTAVATLDVNSLYPSVQQACNLCFSTLVDARTMSPDILRALGCPTPYRTTVGDFYFCRAVEGIIPRMLRRLLDRRRGFKSIMAAHPEGSPPWAVANAAQMAVKVVMNSVYGASRANWGMLPCPELGAVTCHQGAGVLRRVVAHLGSAFPAVRVLYGDTDSVMLAVRDLEGPHPMTDAFATARAITASANAALAADEAMVAMTQAGISPLPSETAVHAWMMVPRGAARVASIDDPVLAGVLGDFKQVVALELEKIYKGFLSVKAKGYAGVQCNGPDDPGVITAKGIRMVRRDVPEFVKTFTRDVLRALFDWTPMPDVWRIAHDAVVRICRGHAEVMPPETRLPTDLPLSAFVLTKRLTPGYLKQAVCTAQAAVHYAAEYACPGGGFFEGDRIPYVMASTAESRRLEPPPWIKDKSLAPPLVGSPPPVGPSVHRSQAAYARSVAEFEADTTLMIRTSWYVDLGVLSVMKQLLAEYTADAAEVTRYAAAAERLWDAVRVVPSAIRVAFGLAPIDPTAPRVLPNLDSIPPMRFQGLAPHKGSRSDVMVQRVTAEQRRQKKAADAKRIAENAARASAMFFGVKK